MRGCFGGFPSGWNLKSCRCDGMWSFSSGIGLYIFYAHLGKVLTILKIYGPYVNRVPSWNSLLNKDFVTNWEVTLTSPWDVLRFGDLRRFQILWNIFLLTPFCFMISTVNK